VEFLSHFGRVDASLHFVGQVNVGVLIQPVVVGDVLDRRLTILGLLGPEEIAQVVEVVVRRFGEGGWKVDFAEARRLVVVEDAALGIRSTARHLELTGVVDLHAGRQNAGLHLCGRRDQLEGAAGRVETLDRVVVERAHTQ
jgi:hypothetical protein